MATRRERTLRLNIIESRRGRALKDVEDDVDRLGRKAKNSGEKGGKDYGDGFAKGLSSKLTGISDTFSGKFRGLLTKELTSATEFSAKSVATAFSAQFLASAGAGLASGVGKLAHGLGSVAALLPAAASAGALAFGTLKLAVLGVGDALKEGLAGDTEKFEEALKGLAPAAQAVVRETVDLKSGFDSLKGVVQENFFAPLVGAVRPLADRYFPILESSMGRIASSFGDAARRSVDFLENEETAAAMNVAFGHMATAIDNVVRGATNLVPALFPLIEVGSTFLPSLTSGFADATLRLQDFLQRAQSTGQLRDFIQGGLDKLRELWETLQQVGRIIGHLATIGKEAMAGLSGVFEGLGVSTGGILDTLEAMTSRAAEFVQTAQGSRTLSTIFEVLGSVLSGAFGWLQRLGQLVGRVFGPIAPQIAELFESFANFKTQLIDALEPALVAIGGVLGRNVLPAMSDLFDLLARNRPVLQGIGIAIATLLLPSTIAWAAATIAAAAPWIVLGAAIAGFAALVIVHFDTIRDAVVDVFNWVRDNWPLLLTILTGPIGLAVTFIVQHWDTIWNAGKVVFGWIVDNWHLLFGILTGPIGLAVGFIVGSWDSIVSTVAGLPSRIGEAAAGMWDGIRDAFRSVINTIIGWWNGISFTLPKIEIPGFDPPGPGSFGGFTIGGQTFSTPDITPLAEGGIVQASPGGVLAVIGEGPHDEAVVPLDGRHGIAAPAPVTLVLQPDGSRVSALLVALLRESIRERGGNVQFVLGQS